MEFSDAVEEGISESSDDGLVEIFEASDEDLDAFIQADQGSEAEESPAHPQEVSTPAPEVEATPEQPKAEETEQSPPPAPSVEELEAVKARLAQAEKYAKQRGTEIGELRKALRESIAEKDAQARDLEMDNPREAARLDRVIDAEKVKEFRLQQEEERLARVHDAYQTVPRYVKPEEMDVEAIRAELLQDGLQPEWVTQFMPNMFEQALPETIIHLAKRAYYGKIIRALVPELQKRDARIAELESKSRGKGENILSGIKKAASSPPPLTTASSASQAPGRSPSVDPSKMSDAELEEYLSNL
jgi:hypothetical protein